MRRRIEARIVNDMLGTDQVPVPDYATDGAAGIDLRACTPEPVTLAPGDRRLFPTGLAINIQDPGLAAMVASRSGLSLRHGVRVAQGLGVVDSDYHGEVGVILINEGIEPYTVNPGERIAQLLFMPVVQVALSYVTEFSSVTERGAGGFGHTGRA
ncbi:MAG: dUTP diphosphatase [Aquisalimonadaceae bacterium]